MSCRRYRDSVVLLADGELPDDAAKDVRSHVEVCEDCAATLGELERLQSLLTPAESEGTTPAEARFWRSFEADLALRVNRQATPFWRRAIVLPVPAAVAMGIAVVALGITVVRQRAESERLVARNAKLEAHLMAAFNETVSIAVSPEAQSMLRALDESGKNDVAPRRRPLPDARLGTARTARPAKDAFALPAPHVLKGSVLHTESAPPALPAGVELRFIDTASADFY